MIIGMYQSITILVIIFIFYLMDFALIHRYDRQRRASGSGRSWDFTLLMLVTAVLVITQPVLLPWLGISTRNPWGLGVQIIGLVLVSVSLILHAWARLHLRQFYAERVEVLPDHQVVDTGPYSFVRHPVITSFFGIVIGLFLVNPALTTLLVMLYTFWDFLRAARQEEELLSKALPDYIAYMARIPRFLPRLWRKK